MTNKGPTGTLSGLVSGMRRRPKALAPVVMLGVLALGVFAFLVIAAEVAGEDVHAADRWLFLALRDPAQPSEPLGPAWLQEAALEVTALGGHAIVVLSVLAVAGLLVVTRRYGPALYVVLSVGTGALVLHVLKLVYDRARPDLVAHLDVVHTASFPSGHATLGTVVYLTLAALVVRFFADWRLRIYVLAVAVLLSFLVGLTRVYLGVHWPSDVAAGWALGVAWASLAWLVSALLQRRRRSARRAGEGG